MHTHKLQNRFNKSKAWTSKCISILITWAGEREKESSGWVFPSYLEVRLTGILYEQTEAESGHLLPPPVWFHVPHRQVVQQSHHVLDQLWRNVRSKSHLMSKFDILTWKLHDIHLCPEVVQFLWACYLKSKVSLYMVIKNSYYLKQRTLMYGMRLLVCCQTRIGFFYYPESN